MYREVDRVQTKLTEGLREILKRHKLKAVVQSVRGIFIVHFIDKDVVWSVEDLKKADSDMSHQFRIRLADEGILILFGGRWLISGAHTEEDIDRTLECADRAVGRL
jgi:glutamate-1-semialdehyde 2,1-aminomutase